VQGYTGKETVRNLQVLEGGNCWVFQTCSYITEGVSETCILSLKKKSKNKGTFIYYFLSATLTGGGGAVVVVGKLSQNAFLGNESNLTSSMRQVG